MMWQHIAPFGAQRPRVGCCPRASSLMRPCGPPATALRPKTRAPRSALCRALDNWAGQPSSLASQDSGALREYIEGSERGAGHAPGTPAATGSGASSHDGPASPGPQPDSPDSWEAWLKVFDDMDKAYDQQEHLRILLQDAVRQENYAKAAALKAELTDVQGKDQVAAVRQALATALREERYADAARLRDQGMAWMQGWWAGATDGEAVGHVMHVVPEFGRFTGRVYTARELADLSGWQESGGGLAALRAALAADSTSPSGHRHHGGAQAIGTPAMELFVVRDTAGRLVHKPVALGGAPVPTPMPVAEPATASTPAAGLPVSVDNEVIDVAGSMGLGTLMKLTVVVGQDGSASIRAAPVPNATALANKPLATPPPTRLSDSEADEAAATLRALADVPGAAPLPGTAVPDDCDAEEEALAAALAARSAALRAAAAASQQAQDTGDKGVNVVDGAETVPKPATESDTPGGGEDDVDDGLSRAQLRRVLEYVSDRADQGSTDLNNPREAFTELHRAPASLTRVTVDEFLFQTSQPLAAAAGARQGLGPSSAAEEDIPAAARFEILIPVDQLSRGGSAQADAAVDMVAERVSRLRAVRPDAGAVDAGALRTALHALLRNVSAGLPGDMTVPSAMAATAAAAAAKSGPKPVRYHRLAPAAPPPPSTDPFDGLYIGSFGPHGPELLRLQRVLIGGEEMVQATKVTGDANVPAGAVSFRAKIGRKQRLPPTPTYPEELGLSGRYRGQGRVAGKGYTRPKWVEGELLVFGPGAPPSLTNGAALGFVWHVPGERKFLILLNRVDLAACTERSSGGANAAP